MIASSDSQAIAAELRRVANDSLNGESLQRALARITGADDSSWRGVMRHLADLIEPPTSNRKRFTADELRARRNQQHYESLVRCGHASVCPECGGYTTSDNGYHIRCAKEAGIPIKMRSNA